MASEPFINYPPIHQAHVDTQPTTLLKKDEKEEKDKEKPKKDEIRVPKSSSQAKASLVIINIASGLDGSDDQLLPSSFRALEVELGLHPAMLGQITLVQTLMLSLGSPIWGFLSDRNSRKWILAIGTFAWGAATIGLAWVEGLWQIMLLRAVNGFFLGSVGPISQSILADVAQTGRGFAFGVVQLSSCIGRLIGGFVTTAVAFLPVGSILGWRVCFMVVGGLSILLSLFISLFMKEFTRKIKLKSILEKENSEDSIFYIYIKHYRDIFKESVMTASVVIVTLEGVLGTIPWSAFSFNTMFFQYCGMTDLQAALITGALLVGAAGGGIIGGKLGDLMYIWSRGHGRPLIGQLAILGRVPLIILAYGIIPRSSSNFWWFLTVAFFVGLTSIAGIAVNRPILADVVRPNHRGTVFSMVVSLEGSVASVLGAPMVGILAEYLFGYQRSILSIKDMSFDLRDGNAYALSKALMYQTVIPWALSFVLYGFLHFTYSSDQDYMNSVIEKDFEFVEDSSEGE